MRLVADKCPECGARVQVDGDVPEARCEYCGATFRLGAAARADGAAARRGPPEDWRPALPARGRRGLLGIALPAVVALAIAGGVVLSLRTSPPEVAAEAEAVQELAEATLAESPPSWLPHRQAILVDVNGDGLKDPIGWARYYARPETPQHLVALDAATGARLWQSDAFPANDWSEIRVALTGDRLLVGDTAGLLRAIDVQNGRTMWSAPLGERVSRICRRTEGGALLYLKDRRAVEVGLANGALTPRGAADPHETDCETLETGETGQSPGVRIGVPPFRYGYLPEIEGLETSRVLQADGSRLAFALGVKAPGTAVPMVAAFDPAERPVDPNGDTPYTAVWRSAVASATALSVVQNAPEIAWFADGRLYVPYATTGEGAAQHLACLDAASGRVLYDAVLRDVEPTSAWGLAGADGRLYLTHRGGLEVFDARNGGHLLHLSD